jgi:enoyl-CoA hydratase/carnithine racemase
MAATKPMFQETWMSPERIRLSVDEAGVAEVVLSRPDKMNALDSPMFDALVDTIERLHRTPGLRVVVLHGEGRAFCAGLDMGNFERMGRDDGTSIARDLVTRTHGAANRAQQAAWGWRQLPVPVIAAVHGVAFGGGLQVALGADVRLVGADLRMCVMEIKWGLVPDMAGCVLMNQLARTDVVRELCFSGRIFSGPEAVTMGLATRVCEDPLQEARRLAGQIAALSPDAVRANKRLLNLALKGTDTEVLMAESAEQQALMGSANQVEAVHAALQKRPAQFADGPTEP